MQCETVLFPRKYIFFDWHLHANATTVEVVRAEQREDNSTRDFRHILHIENWRVRITSKASTAFLPCMTTNLTCNLPEFVCLEVDP